MTKIHLNRLTGISTSYSTYQASAVFAQRPFAIVVLFGCALAFLHTNVYAISYSEYNEDSAGVIIDVADSTQNILTGNQSWTRAHNYSPLVPIRVNLSRIYGNSVVSRHNQLDLDDTVAMAATSYVTTDEGYIARSDGARKIANSSCTIKKFNPASNTDQVSLLQLKNADTTRVEVIVEGTDENGSPAPEGKVKLVVPKGESRIVSVLELEQGTSGLEGKLGTGVGIWELTISTGQSIEISHLLEVRSGAVTVPTACEPPQASLSTTLSKTWSEDVVSHGFDFYELNEVSVKRNTLMANISYGGGCRTHEFALIMSDSFTVTKSETQLEGSIAHNANGDLCEAWLTEDIEFDLTPIKDLHRNNKLGGESVMLILKLPNDKQVEVQYNF